MSGYNFGGKKARLLKARLKFLRDNPEAAKMLARGVRPPGYPDGIQAPPCKGATDER